ncbi:pyocin knob domain-containing protein [Pseudomonas sp. LF052]
MARQEIDIGTRPTGAGGDTPRSAMIKINAMTDELYRGDALAKASGWGASLPIPMKPTESADGLPVVNGLFMFGDGGVSLPFPYVYIIQMLSGTGGYVRQVAYSLVDNMTWERQFRQGAAAGTAWTQLLKAGDFGYGGAVKLLTTSADNVQATGEYYGNNIPGPNGPNSYGFLSHKYLSAQYATQEWVNPDTANTLFRRVNANGTWTDWARVYTAANALNDPSTGTGLMNKTVVGGWTVSKYANGQICIQGVGPVTPVLPPSQATLVTVSMPVAILAGTGRVFVNAQPQNTYDHYGALNCYVNGTAAVDIIIRNGPGSQAFQPAVTVWGYWK